MKPLTAMLLILFVLDFMILSYMFSPPDEDPRVNEIQHDTITKCPELEMWADSIKQYGMLSNDDYYQFKQQCDKSDYDFEEEQKILSGEWIET